MHVSQFLTRSLLTPSRAVSVTAPVQAGRIRQSRLGPLTLSLIALFGVLVLCSRTVYAATYTVTDLSDSASDTGSLRYAVNTAVDGDTIDFAPNVIGTITLTNGTLTIANSITIEGPGAVLLTISGNHTTTVFTINTASAVNISGLTIANGLGNPGGIANSGTLTVESCVLSGNHGTGNGAGILNNDTLTITNSTFSGNISQFHAGGIFNSGTLTVSNSTFFGNQAGPGAGGGGIFDEGPTMTVYNSTFTGNTDSIGGGGILNNTTYPMTITNSIVAGNHSGDCYNCGTQSANNMIGGTPDLGPLQYNGGATETMVPLPGSPAIGAGSSSTLATDQRGFLRPTSGVSDLGAVQTNYLTVNTTADSTDAGTCTGGATCSLRDAINLANSDGSGDIVFQSGLTGTITLSGILPSITADTNIVGPGALLMTISANGSNSMVMDIPYTGTRVNLSGVTIFRTNDPSSLAAAVSNSGIMSVENSVFSDNLGQNGGAILNVGILGVQNATFSNNIATYGGGIDNQGTLVVANGTFTGNRAYNGNGGGIENSGNAIVFDSTFTGNEVLNGALGGGMDNSGGLLTVSNSIITENTNVDTNTEDDCHNCTQSGPLLTGGTDPRLGPLAYIGYGSLVPTLIPLPGSPAIQAGDATQLPVGLTKDERGFPRLTAGKLDLGAVQTNYTSVDFLQQPSDAVLNADISPAVTVEVLETNNNLVAPNNIDVVENVPITLTLNGPGTLGGTLTQTTSGAASFGNLTVNTVGSGDTLATSLTVTPSGITPAQTLTATSNPFDITLEPSTVSFNPTLPASVTYGVAPLTLKANATSSGTFTGQSVSFQVDSGPATISGNVLTITGAGTVVVEVDAIANATYAASTSTATITVLQAASQLALTASASQAAIGSSVTLTATATSTAGIPTGPVTFMSGSNSLGTAALNAQGVAALAVTTLPAGSNTITATYAGDTNFLGSQSQLAGTILVGTPGFSMTSGTVTLSIQPGSAGNLALTLTPAFGYTGTLYLACGNMPGASTCAFQPAAVQFDGSGNPVQVTVTMQIASAQLLSRRTHTAELRPLTPLGGLPLLPAMIFWLPGSLSEVQRTGKQRKTRIQSSRWLWTVVLLLFGAGLLGLNGCAGQLVTPTGGQYNVTITAAGPGNLRQTIAVQLNVP